jgi:TfoX/Sxy family transcriptional regulator of competence genes
MLYRESVPGASRFLVIIANITIVNTKQYTLAEQNYNGCETLSEDSMPSSPESLEAVKAILPEATSRKMMGEYLLYMDGKLFGGIYDDRLLLKITKASASILRDYPSDFPYEGGGEMILLTEPYDAALLRETVEAMCAELPARRR